MAQDQKVVHVGRGFTLRRPGKEDLKFVAGRNVVDSEAAGHSYVVAHLTAPVDASAGELEHDLTVARARIAELEAELLAKDDEMAAVLKALDKAPKKK
jgi:hypothetical protein